MFDYGRSLAPIEDEVLEAVRRVLRSGKLILGPETQAFEEEFAAYCGARHCIAVSSGTTALHLALWGCGVGPGDEVITVSNTCPPTPSAIRLTGAAPVFVDVDDKTLLMDIDSLAAKLTDRTRAIMPVHLWGGAVDLDALNAFATDRGLTVIEDCAQAHGTLFQGRQVGTFGAAGCFSFYPTKNIGAYGDAGAVITNDDALAERMRAIRMYGYKGEAVSQIAGMNVRINEIQATILRIKLRIYPDWLDRRLSAAHYYDDHISNPNVSVPARLDGSRPAFHQYVLRCQNRDAVISALQVHGIGFGIHYPVPCHKMPAFAEYAASDGLPVTDLAASEVLSLPVHEALTSAEIAAVAEAVNNAAHQ